MEPNENNPLKPQPTGGLKLMTVFIAVLALHVLVIGGFTVWHLLYPANADSNLALDKSSKSKVTSDSTIGDVTTTDSGSSDKTSAPAPADGSTTADATASTDDGSTANPAPATTAATTTPAPTAPTAPVAANASAPTANSVISVPSSPVMPATPTVVEDASAAAANPEPDVTAQTPSGPIHHGPVVNPPDTLAPPVDASASGATADNATPDTAADGIPYTVKRGDSLARIAHRHHVALAKLRSANSLAANSPLHIGQKLVIPSRATKVDASEALATTTASAPATTPTSTAAAPVYPVAQPVQESDDATASTATPAPRTSLASALPRHTHKTTLATHHLYTVVKGDTLTKIAKRYHTTTSAIMAVNSLTNAGRLSIGQKLHIPPHESREAATAQQAAPAAESHATPKGQFANYVQ